MRFSFQWNTEHFASILFLCLSLRKRLITGGQNTDPQSMDQSTVFDELFNFVNVTNKQLFSIVSFKIIWIKIHFHLTYLLFFYKLVKKLVLKSKSPSYLWPCRSNFLDALKTGELENATAHHSHSWLDTWHKNSVYCCRDARYPCTM